jgi:hypothetical protein
VTHSNKQVAARAAVLVIAVLAGIGFVQGLTEAKMMERETKVTVEVTAAPARTLEVRVTNETPTPITVFRHSLPWSSAYSALLVAVKTDAPGTVLDRSRPIDDPIVGTVTIQPKETVTGEIDLDRRFPGLPDGLRERDVIVFWSHQLQTVDGDLLPRTGGWVLLPKQG